jgi:hypothetical protein
MDNSDFATQFTGLVTLCLCIFVPLTVALLWHSIRVIFTSHQKVNLTESKSIIAEAPVAWIFSGFVGWIYVDSNNQVGVIGTKVFERPGLFFELPASPKQKMLFSKLIVPYTAEISTSTRDNIFLKVSISAFCKVKTNLVNRILNEIQNPDEYLNKSLQSGLANFVQTHDASFLKGSPTAAAKKLGTMYVKNMPFFEITVQSLVCEGQHIQDLDGLARVEDKVRLALTESNLRLQESMKEKVIDMMVKTLTANSLAKGKDVRQEIQRILESISTYGVDATFNSSAPSVSVSTVIVEDKTTTDMALPDDGRLNAFRQDLERAVARSEFRLLQDDRLPYEIEFKRYRVSLNPGESQNSINVSIYDANNRAMGNTIWQKSLIELLILLQSKIEKKVSS